MTEEEFKTGKKASGSKAGAQIATKDFHIFAPPKVDVKIKKGDDVSKLGLPDRFIENLKTEGVLKG